jgi:hypothetical protein
MKGKGLGLERRRKRGRESGKSQAVVSRDLCEQDLSLGEIGMVQLTLGTRQSCSVQELPGLGW